LIFVTRTGGVGGFLASVRDIGVVHPPGINVSAEETERGGAGGSFFSRGGGTKPGSSDPSPASTDVPAHSVAAKTGMMNLLSIYFTLSVRDRLS
jgi:hypothetical protein